MAKWADFGISAVRYDVNHKHIVSVMAHPDNGDTIGTGEVQSRQKVIANIKLGLTYVTIIRSNDGKWKLGQPVKIVKINGVEYIKTDSNSTERDNLENLPEF